MWPTQFMSKAFRRISFVISRFPGLGGCSQCSGLGTGRDTELQPELRARGYVFWRRVTIFQRARPYRGARRQRPAKLVPADSSTRATPSPRRRSACPTMPAHSRPLPYCPLALIADAVDEFGFADRLQLDRAVGLVH